MSVTPVPDLAVDFTAQDRHLFFREIAAAARDYKTVLGEKSGDGGSPSSILLQESLAMLSEESIQFSPVLEVVPLSEQSLGNLDHGLPSGIAGLMKGFDFYLLNIPVTMIPAPGWGFTQLECSIELNPGSPPDQRPVSHDIFPKEESHDMIRANPGLSMRADENLDVKGDSSVFAP